MNAQKLNQKMAETTSTAHISRSEQIRRDRHYKDREKELPTKPFIYLPFNRHYPVAQGWLATAEETRKSGVENHWGLDFKTPYGTPLFAPVKGFLVASIEANWRTKAIVKDGKTIQEPMLVDGKRISYGGGIVVEIIAEDGQRVQILHLASLDKALGKKAFSKPSPDKDGQWAPTGIRRSLNELMKLGLGVPVEVGQPIGTVGYSGLGINHIGVIYNGEDWPNDIPENAFTTWDDIGAHPHMAAHFRDELGNKYGIRDIASIYSGDPKDYNDGNGRLKVGPDALVITDSNNIPRLAA